MVILFSVLGVLIVVFAAVLLTVLHGNAPTKGSPIARYDHPKSALLVMDVQKDTMAEFL